MPRSGIAGWYSDAIFCFVRNLHAVLHSGTNFHSHQQCRSVAFFPHPHQHLLFIDFWPVWDKAHWIFFSVIISDVEHLCMCLIVSKYNPWHLKLLEENIGKTLSDINRSSIFLDQSPKSKEIKGKINKWDLIKLKGFCVAKEAIKKTKRQPTG